MYSPIKFYSHNYVKINWAEILTSIYAKLGDSSPCVLSRHGWLLIPNSFSVAGDIDIAMPFSIYRSHIQDLQFLTHDFLTNTGIKIARIPHKKIRKHEKSPYIKICSDIFDLIYKKIQIILTYTFEHLDQRESEGCKLTQHEGIRFSIGNIICDLNSAEKLRNSSNDLNAVFSYYDYLMSALHTLARIGGGRSVLSGNAIEMMFHLRLFQSLFLRSKEII